MQRIFQLQQSSRLFFRQTADRDLCPCGYHICHIFFCNRHFLSGTFLFLFLLFFFQFFFVFGLFKLNLRCFFKISTDDAAFLFLLQKFQFLLNLFQLPGHLITTKLLSGRCFIHQIDCLIRKKTVVYITSGKLNRCLQRFF